YGLLPTAVAADLRRSDRSRRPRHVLPVLVRSSRMNPPTMRTLAQVDAAWAWAPFEPGTDGAWDLTAAVHLYRRAGYGATWGELQQAIAGTPAAAVQRLVRGGEGSDTFEQQMADAAEPLLGGSRIESLAAWWLYGMLQTPHPLHERMTLFWHGH